MGSSGEKLDTVGGCRVQGGGSGKRSLEIETHLLLASELLVIDPQGREGGGSPKCPQQRRVRFQHLAGLESRSWFTAMPFKQERSCPLPPSPSISNLGPGGIEVGNRERGKQCPLPFSSLRAAGPSQGRVRAWTIKPHLKFWL